MIAAVLAGGLSRRFRRNKLLYPLRGKPIIEWVIDALRASRYVDSVYLVTTPKVQIPRLRGVTGVVTDKLSVGPIGGILVALEELGDCLVVAGDMPLISPDFIDELVRTYIRDEAFHIAYVPTWPNGYLEPLHTIYLWEFSEVIKDYLSKGVLSTQEVLRDFIRKGYVMEVPIPPKYRNCLLNINTHADLARAEELLSHAVPIRKCRGIN